MNEERNDWRPETRSLLKTLSKWGFRILGGDNGEYTFKYSNDIVADLTACDETKLFIEGHGRKETLWLVYGNSPGELVCDYTCAPNIATTDPLGMTESMLDKAVNEHSEKWDGRAQPVICESATPGMQRIETEANSNGDIVIRYNRQSSDIISPCGEFRLLPCDLCGQLEWRALAVVSFAHHKCRNTHPHPSDV